MKQSKNGHHFINIDHMEKYLITNLPPQSLDLQFFECQWKQSISIGHYETIIKMAAIS